MIVAIFIGSFIIFYLVVNLLRNKSNFWALYAIFAMLAISFVILAYVSLK